MTYNQSMPKGGGIRPNLSIRMKPETLHRARIAAVTRKKTLGKWLEEAIEEKIDREQKIEGEAKG
jgi:predicted DNA-binding protein